MLERRPFRVIAHSAVAGIVPDELVEQFSVEIITALSEDHLMSLCSPSRPTLVLLPTGSLWRTEAKPDGQLLQRMQEIHPAFRPEVLAVQLGTERPGGSGELPTVTVDHLERVFAGQALQPRVLISRSPLLPDPLVTVMERVFNARVLSVLPHIEVMDSIAAFQPDLAFLDANLATTTFLQTRPSLSGLRLHLVFESAQPEHAGPEADSRDMSWLRGPLDVRRLCGCLVDCLGAAVVNTLVRARKRESLPDRSEDLYWRSFFHDAESTTGTLVMSEMVLARFGESHARYPAHMQMHLRARERLGKLIEGILPFLVAISGPTGNRTNQLRPLMRHPDVYVRLSVLGLLKVNRDAQTLEVALEALEDEDLDVQAKALWLLGEIGSTEQVPVLAPYLAADKRSFREIAARSLACIGGDAGLGILTAVLRSGNEVAAEAAAFGLGESRDVRATDALRDTANHRTESGVRHQIQCALDKLTQV